MTDHSWQNLGSTMTLAAISAPAFQGVFVSSAAVAWSSGTLAGLFNAPGARYLLEVSTSAGFESLAASSDTAQVAASALNLAADATHYFRVRSYNSDGTFDPNWLTPGSTITLPVAPGNPTGPVFSGVSTFTLTLAWSSGTAAEGFNGPGSVYAAEISTKAGFSPVWASSATLENSALFTSTLDNSTFYARVRVLGRSGVPSADLVLGSTITPAAAPTSVIFSQISTRSITATAFAPPPAFSNLDQGQSGTRMAKDGSWDGWLGSAQHPFNGLQPNTLYAFKAKARNSIAVETAESPVFSTYTLAAVAAPQNGPVFQGRQLVFRDGGRRLERAWGDLPRRGLDHGCLPPGRGLVPYREHLRAVHGDAVQCHTLFTGPGLQ
jgi:hypothetical protein